MCKKAEEMEKGLGNATRSLEVDHEAAFKPIRELLFADTDEDHSGIQVRRSLDRRYWGAQRARHEGGRSIPLGRFEMHQSFTCEW